MSFWKSGRGQGLMLLAPALIVYCLFAVYPMLNVVVLSFMRWNGLTTTTQFVGLDNYVQVFTQDPVFWTAARNTILWTAMSVVFPPAIGFLLALGSQPKYSRTRAAAGPVLHAGDHRPDRCRNDVALDVRPVFWPVQRRPDRARPRQGLIQDWLGDRNVALYSMFVASVWQTVGFSLVLFLAGLQSVSPTLIEASRVDGANRFQMFRYVTLPALRPSITIVLILSIINSLKAFDIVYGMTQGGPAQSTQMLALWAFTQAMQLGDFGRGAAISVVLLLVTTAIVVPYLRWMRGHRERPRERAGATLPPCRRRADRCRAGGPVGCADRHCGRLDCALRLHHFHCAQGQFSGDGVERFRAADQPGMG